MSTTRAFRSLLLRAFAVLSLAILALSASATQHLAPVAAQSVGNTAQTKENLDLPYDAVGEGADEEDAPEVVQFYGQNYEGDGIFYVIDRSGSMQSSGELEIAKREVTRNLSEFSSRVWFGIVFFDANVVKYPASGQPQEATSANKQGGINWVQGMKGGNGSCVQQGLVAGLQFANRAASERRVVIYVGDGGGTCHGADEPGYHRQTLGVVKRQNYQKAQINCIGVLQVGSNRRQFLQTLASMNSGTYSEITR